MLIVGLVGGIGSGKSAVAQLFAEQGAVVLDADRIGHEVLTWPEVRELLVERWGVEVLGADGTLDRRKIAARVFAEPTASAQRRFEAGRELEYLESVTHPRIRQRIEASLEECRRAEPQPPLVVLDAPVMLEAGWAKYCDKIVYVDAPVETRLARAVARGWSQEEFAAREAVQKSPREKREQSDLILDNSQSLGYTKEQVTIVWNSLVGSFPPNGPRPIAKP
jgi:dephospho-CoA kinase